MSSPSISSILPLRGYFSTRLTEKGPDPEEQASIIESIIIRYLVPIKGEMADINAVVLYDSLRDISAFSKGNPVAIGLRKDITRELRGRLKEFAEENFYLQFAESAQAAGQAQRKLITIFTNQGRRISLNQQLKDVANFCIEDHPILLLPLSLDIQRLLFRFVDKTKNPDLLPKCLSVLSYFTGSGLPSADELELRGLLNSWRRSKKAPVVQVNAQEELPLAEWTNTREKSLKNKIGGILSVRDVFEGEVPSETDALHQGSFSSLREYSLRLSPKDICRNVRALLLMNVDPMNTYHTLNKNRQNVFHRCRNPKVMRILIRHLMQRGELNQLQEKDSNGETPLHCHVANRGRNDIVAQMISVKSTLSLQDSQGRTPLHTALAAADKDSEYFSTASMLLKCSSHLLIRNNKGETPLQIISHMVTTFETLMVRLEKEASESRVKEERRLRLPMYRIKKELEVHTTLASIIHNVTTAPPTLQRPPSMQPRLAPPPSRPRNRSVESRSKEQQTTHGSFSSRSTPQVKPPTPPPLQSMDLDDDPPSVSKTVVLEARAYLVADESSSPPPAPAQAFSAAPQEPSFTTRLSNKLSELCCTNFPFCCTTWC